MNTYYELESLLKDRFSQTPEVLTEHAKDKSWHIPEMPQAVCYPIATEEVVEIVKICNTSKTPIIPFGAGTSIEGQIIPYQGGVSVDLSKMNKILKIHAQDQDCEVQAGVRKKQLNEALVPHKLFFPAGPAINPSIGGMASTRASGLNAVRYGTMKENVRSLTAVSPTGEVIRTGARAVKSSAGYDLTSLFIGAEGTLGIITSLVLRLTPLPEVMLNAVVPFPNLDQAIKAVTDTLARQIPISCIEILDELQLQAVNQYANMNHELTPTLFIELHSSEDHVHNERKLLEKMMRQNGGKSFTWATDETERKALWQARAECYYAALAMEPEAEGFTTDVCVPISRLAECIRETKKDLEELNIQAPLLGHVGDGNFHCIMLVDPKDAERMKKADLLHERLVRRAIRMDGTCTGEHGIGVGKQKFLEEEKGPGAMNMMRAIKNALDPNGIMNPGKMFI